MTEAIASIGGRTVQPDPSIAEAVGQSHSLETAIADIIDNSVDADATHVHVRFVITADRLSAIRVIDDGRGMSADQLDNAMAYARKRDYLESDQGHFGLGLKAASMSQARVLTVLSRGAGGQPSGRRIHDSKRTFIEDLDAAGVASAVDAHDSHLPDQRTTHGTIVEWSDLKTGLRTGDYDDTSLWIEGEIGRLSAHLGLTFHRLLTGGQVRITLDSFDRDFGFAGPSRPVAPIDPFGYAGGDDAAWEFRVKLSDADVVLRAHVWPARNAANVGYHLAGAPEATKQGLFVYRADRLLQAGGWNGIANEHNDLAFARVEVELERAHEAFIAINPEKAGVKFSPELVDAIDRSTDTEGRTFRQYLDFARARGKEARERSPQPISVPRVGQGLAPAVRAAIEEHTTSGGMDAVTIRWSAKYAPDPVYVDLDDRILWLNYEMRDVLGDGSLDTQGAPVIKTLFLLLYADYFSGTRLGSRKKRELAARNAIITAAVETEIERRRSGREGEQP